MTRPVLVALVAVGMSFPCFGAPAAHNHVETILRSVPIPQSNGVTFDSQDHLVIASVATQAILVMDTNTGKIIKKYTDPLIASPDDVDVAKDGSIYFTDMHTGNIGRISPDGKVSVVENLGPWVNSLRMSPAGDQLFVGHCIGADRLTIIDLTGKAKPRVFAEGIGWPNSMSFGPDGRLYTPLNVKRQVVRWNTDTGESEVVVNLDSIPSSVKFDSKGRMLISEFQTGRVLRFDPATKELKVLSDRLGSGLDNVGVDSKGRVFATSNNHGGVTEILEDGSLKSLSPQGLLTPSGLTVMQGSSGEQLVVADYANLRFYDIKSLKQTRTLNTGFYPYVKDEKEMGEAMNFVFPFTVAVDGKTLIATSYVSNAVNVFDLQQNRVTRNIDGNTPLNAIAFGSDIIVSELKTQSVVSISENGERRTLASGISVPSGLVAKQRDLWVADWSKGQILKVISNGEVLERPSVLVQGLARPEGMAIGPDGSILAVESGAGRLLKVDPTNGKTTVLADNLKTGLEGLSEFPPTNYFSAVAVDADGWIYVSCDAGREVVRMKGPWN